MCSHTVGLEMPYIRINWSKRREESGAQDAQSGLPVNRASGDQRFHHISRGRELLEAEVEVLRYMSLTLVNSSSATTG